MALADNSLFVVQHNGSPHSLTFSNLKTYQADYFLPLDGGEMTGNLLVLYPTANEHAASKEYVDDEIFVLRSELEDSISNLGNGRFVFKSSGSFQVPSDGEFYFSDSTGTNFSPNFVDAGVLFINNKNTDGSFNAWSDLKAGEYLRMKLIASSEHVVYTVTSILFSDTTYAQVGIAIHQISAGLPNLPSQNSVFQLNTLHIDGIDLNDLEQELDTRYLKLTSSSEQKLTGDVNFNNNLKVGGDKVVIDNNGNAEFKNVVTALEYEGDGAKLTGIVRSYTGTSAPSDPEEGDIWFKEDATLYAPPGALHVYKNSMWMAAATPYDLAGLDSLP